MSCHIYPMSMSLHNHSDLEQIEVEFTPEQTEVPVRAATGRQGAPALEPLPIETLTDPAAAWSLHQATSHGSRLRTGQVGLLVRVLLYVGLLVGIAYVRQIGEEPIQVAQKVDPKLARVGEERAPTAPSADSAAMLIKNPFDRAEAFEFPPGTKQAPKHLRGRRKVVDGLRAHDRVCL